MAYDGVIEDVRKAIALEGPGRLPVLARSRISDPHDTAASGPRPFGYPRLIQPILDRRCVRCHDGPSRRFPSSSPRGPPRIKAPPARRKIATCSYQIKHRMPGSYKRMIAPAACLPQRKPP